MIGAGTANVLGRAELRWGIVHGVER
jgi:hypothetical protein